MAVRVVPLGSGSKGNVTLVEFGATRILVDAGLSAKDVAQRLEAIGVASESITCLLLTHEHHDHSRGVERFSKKHKVPVACAPDTLEAMNLSYIHLARWHAFEPGRPFEIGDVTVDPFHVPHDAARPVGFLLRGHGVRVGIATDLGHATTLVVERLRGSHVVMVEANHDDAMLRDGPYPWHLKQRVGGNQGHLSNDEAAALVAAVATDDCRAVILAHLSDQNNTPALARRAASMALADAGRHRLEMRIARRSRPTPEVVL
jgi:phosphoribosyl 1,2-cyclic phosphodiesterase